ncbi:hypothetical protein ACFL1Z_09025, partial [Thermodesulfobacteriota bacterium]
LNGICFIRRLEMDKILILADKPETENYLVQNLNLLFPECKIEIKQRQEDAGDDKEPQNVCPNLQVSAGGWKETCGTFWGTVF